MAPTAAVAQKDRLASFKHTSELDKQDPSVRFVRETRDASVLEILRLNLGLSRSVFELLEARPVSLRRIPAPPRKLDP